VQVGPGVARLQSPHGQRHSGQRRDREGRRTASGTVPTRRQFDLDGFKGKQYRIEVIGAAGEDQAFTLSVTYDTGTCT
jgi:hypothetical protein